MCPCADLPWGLRSPCLGGTVWMVSTGRAVCSLAPAGWLPGSAGSSSLGCRAYAVMPLQVTPVPGTAWPNDMFVAVHPAGFIDMPVTDAVADAFVVGAVPESPLAHCGVAHLKRKDICMRAAVQRPFLWQAGCFVRWLSLWLLARRKCVCVLLLPLGIELPSIGVCCMPMFGPGFVAAQQTGGVPAAHCVAVHCLARLWVRWQGKQSRLTPAWPLVLCRALQGHRPHCVCVAPGL